MKKRFLILPIILLLLLFGCEGSDSYAQVAATTLPVYEFTSALCENTDITVTRLITEEVSCLHDYSLNVRPVKAAAAAEVIVISGAGMEEFMDDILRGKYTIDSSSGIELLCSSEEGHDHDASSEESHGHEGHSHEHDPHIWLSPLHAMDMVRNICAGLARQYPEFADTFSANEARLLEQLTQLQEYGEIQLQDLSCRELITFHDGFGYLADCFGLHILEAIEEESGSEASAAELIHMIALVETHQLPAVFVEKNGSASAPGIISRETGAKVFSLDMAMSGDGYFAAMYHNIDTLKEALQ